MGTKLVVWRTKEEVEWPTLLRELADDLEKRASVERGNSDACSEQLDLKEPEEDSSFAEATETLTWSDFLAFISKSRESRSSNSTMPSPKPETTPGPEKSLSSVIDETITSGLSSSNSTTSSTSTEKAGCPTHYQKKDFTTDDVITAFLENLYNSFYIRSQLFPADFFYLGAMVKYLSRAGEKDDWKDDVFKAADYFHKALTGDYLNEVLDED